MCLLKGSEYLIQIQFNYCSNVEMEKNAVIDEISEENQMKETDELDTTELLCQDDSITRRMRHLLEDDVDSLNANRPLLLSNTCLDSGTSDLENAVNLLEIETHDEISLNAKNDHSSDVRIYSPLQTDSKFYDEEKISVHTSDDILRRTDPVTEYLSPELRFLESRSSAFQFDEKRALSEDSMELSDSTEYSDLPKVVIDKPRTQQRTKVDLSDDLNGENAGSASDQIPVEFQNTSKVDHFHRNEPDSQIKVAWTENSSVDKLCSDSELTDKIQISEYSAMQIDGGLDDNKLLDKVHRAVTGEEHFSDDSMKDTLRDEPSNISTVDSLAVQVRDLLQEEKSLMNDMSLACTVTGTDEDISKMSNLSAEIGNFEKTDLWKYTRQFLPGVDISHPIFLPRSAFANSLNGPSRSLNETNFTNGSQVDESPVVKYSSYKQDSLLPAKAESRVNSTMQSNTLQHRERQEEMRKKAESFQLSPQLNSCASQKSRQTCVVGRYSNHIADAAIANESTLHDSNYEILIPDKSIIQTPYSFITPRRVSYRHEQIPSVTYSPEKTSTPMQINTAQKSAYFENNGNRARNNKTAREGGSQSKTTRNSVNSLDLSHSYSRKSLSDRFKSSQFSSDVSEGKYISLRTMAQRGTFEMNDTNDAKNHKEVVAADLDRNMKYGTEFLHSAPTNTPLTTFRRPLLEPRISKSPLHHVEFVTPQVRKNTVLPSAGIPLYDQLPEEVKNGREANGRHTEQTLASNSTKSNGKFFVPKREDEFTELKGDKLPKEYKHIPLYSDNKAINTADSSSKPVKFTTHEIQAVDNHDSVPPAHKHMFDSQKRINNLETVSPRSSDSDLHYRTISPVSLSEQEKTVYKVTKDLGTCSSSESDRDLHDTLGSKQNGILFPTAVANSSGTVDHSNQVQIEPAPLPYVHLSTRRPEKSLEISTEKVQNILRKEKNGGVQPRSHTVAVPLVPKCSEREFSSDDDLVERLRVISENTPVIEELLLKLYARSIENKEKFKQAGQNKITHRKESVSQAIQTDQNIEAYEYVPVNNNSVKDSQGVKRVKPHRLYAEASCQTSLLYPEKSAKEKIKKQSETKKITIGKPREKHWDVNKDHHSLAKDCTKVQSKQPCAFFIDMSCVRAEPPPETQESRIPVAWYEPYQYLPPWRKESVISDGALKPEQLNVQDAFLKHKQNFAIKSWERQENIAIRAEERKISEREKRANRLYDEERNKKKHLLDRQRYFDPIALQHERKKNRELLWKEMKLMSKQKYESLPEVVRRKREAERKKYYAANRERALEYKRKITSVVVERWKMKMENLVH